jgi:predicted enzyme involved in methoxymalonyl-ACP biosynthesis
VPCPDASLRIDTFVLSCRILGRTLEAAVLGWVCRRAQERSASRVRGEIIETERNTPVRDVYARHGFADEGAGHFTLSVDEPIRIPDYFTVTA